MRKRNAGKAGQLSIDDMRKLINKKATYTGCISGLGKVI